jgi:hypothetical protein
MIVTGTRAARSATTSNGSPRRSGATHCSTTSRTRGSQSAIWRGVKPRFTIARIDEWRSPSSAIRLRAFQNVSGLNRIFVMMPHMKRSVSGVSGGSFSLPPAMIIVNIAREEKISGVLSTCITSSKRVTDQMPRCSL